MRTVVSALFACLLVAGCASTVSFPSLDGRLRVVGKLHRPDRGVERMPAVVLLAPCYGVAPFMKGWAEWLKSRGYVALLVDSFAPRGIREACLGPPPTVEEVMQDAVAGVDYLKSLPFVDADRVAVMGWSHGASAALEVDTFRRQNGLPGLKSVIAFYPGCDDLHPDLETPTLLLLAERDDWTPSGACLSLGEAMVREGKPIKWRLYEGATHSFDEPDSFARREDGPVNAREYLGHELYYDPRATRSAHALVRRFLAEHL